MKSRVVAFVCMFCVVGVFGPTADAEKPPKFECITFSGDLESAGETRIADCCPNAGPAPEYEMTLSTGDDRVDGTRSGYLFINVLGTGPSQVFMVKFWTWDSYGGVSPRDGDYFFEIRGGTIVRDRRAKTFIVTYDEEMATGWDYYDDGTWTQFDIPNVSFVLFRSTNLDYCE
jgi:hypothetical protein